MNTKQFQKDFFNQVDESQGLSLLFDYLPDIHLFVKNKQGQFIKANETFLQLLGATDEEAAIGKTDRDFFHIDVAEKYINEDRQVMEQKKPFANIVWQVPNSNGLLIWCLCTKIPLVNQKGQAFGIAGTLCDYKTAGSVLEPYTEMADVTKYIDDNHDKDISIEHLAGLAHLSTRQFERKFNKLFHTTPIKYITKRRLNSACEALSQNNDSITQVALNAGFYDHSYFTKIFTKHIGINPKEYRKQYYKANK